METTSLPRTQKHHATFMPYVAIGAAVLFWGASFVAGRVAFNLLHPQAVMFCRMTVACLVMVPFARRLMPGKLGRKDAKLLVPMVLLQPCLYFLFESHALQLTTASQAGIISASVPLLVAWGAWLFFREEIGLGTVLGLVISVAGVAVLTLFGEGTQPGDNPLLGNALELVAMVCAAGNLLLIKRLSAHHNSWTLTAMQFFTGLIFFSPGIRHIIAAPHLLLNPELILALFCLGVFASVGAFGLYNWSISRLPTTQAAVFLNLVPVLAVFLGWTLLGETLSLPQLGGALLVGCGVLISQRSPSPPPD